MPLLPALKPMFDMMNAGSPASGNDSTPAEARAAMHAMIDASFIALTTPNPPAASETDHIVPVDGGEIVVRLYKPARNGGPLPCHINIHGGGFWLCTLEHSDSGCRGLVQDVGCAVASIDYRLAPEHKFPVAPEDCYAALLWLADNAAALGLDSRRFSIGGSSAGANLAAVVTQMARDRGGPPIVFQLLEIPVTDFTRDDPLVFADEALTVSGHKDYKAIYLRDDADAADPLASPLLAADLSGLPPALILCAEYDPLQPEGEAYAKRLEAAGVPVTYALIEGQFHGCQAMDKLIPDAAKAHQEKIVGALRAALA